MLVRDGFSGITIAIKYFLVNPPQETSGPIVSSVEMSVDFLRLIEFET
jgi:hypothetical protein